MQCNSMNTEQLWTEDSQDQSGECQAALGETSQWAMIGRGTGFPVGDSATSSAPQMFNRRPPAIKGPSPPVPPQRDGALVAASKISRSIMISRQRHPPAKLRMGRSWASLLLSHCCVGATISWHPCSSTILAGIGIKRQSSSMKTCRVHGSLIIDKEAVFRCKT